MAPHSWLPDDSTLVACSNLLLLVLLVVLSMRNNQLKDEKAELRGTLVARFHRATRKLLIAKRRSKGLQYALNITVNQYHQLRRRLRRGKPGGAPTPPLVHLNGPAKMIVPPPLPLGPVPGEDPESWQDSGCHTVGHPSGNLPVDDTRTRPVPTSDELRRLSRPPQN